MGRMSEIDSQLREASQETGNQIMSRAGLGSLQQPPTPGAAYLLTVHRHVLDHLRRHLSLTGWGPPLAGPLETYDLLFCDVVSASPATAPLVANEVMFQRALHVHNWAWLIATSLSRDLLGG